MKIRSLVMIKPRHFAYNAETAESNTFQNPSNELVKDIAIKEFDHFVEVLNSNNIPLTIFEDLPHWVLPDSVFPNNWFSTQPDESIFIYPMLNPSRKAEVRMDIIDDLNWQYGFKKVVDFRTENGICEGTGSLVFDHENRIGYAVLSPRTSLSLTSSIIHKLGYKPVFLEAYRHEKSIYHTNVCLFNTPEFIGICTEVLSKESYLNFKTTLPSGKQIMEISVEQMDNFAGNMLSVDCDSGSFLIMSKTAFNSLEKIQIQFISRFRKPIIVSIPTIEFIGGGSARCMLAEIY